MSAKPNKAAEFLKAMQLAEPAEGASATLPAEAPAVPHAVPSTQPVLAAKAARAAAPSRAGKKHFGGYLGDDTLEKIALLRVRLKKDNSELIEFAIDELFRKHNAKRAFGDA
jgi:hypothetical protein